MTVKYQVINSRTKQVIGVYSTLKCASNECDKLDLEYGAITSYYKRIEIEEGGDIMNIGKIVKINSELKYGFIETTDCKKIFFTEETPLLKTSFDELRVNDPVLVDAKETPRGLLATTVAIKQVKP